MLAQQMNMQILLVMKVTSKLEFYMNKVLV